MKKMIREHVVLNQWFPANDPVATNVARLCILKEDLELEYRGWLGQKIQELDVNQVQWRKLYFLRSILKTMMEIHSAVNSLRMNREFKKAILQQPKPLQEAFEELSKTIAAAQPLIKGYRNSIGGHVLEESGDCYKIRIKAEVIPDEKAMAKAARTKDVTDNPAAPLKVQLWTDKQAYKQREKVKIYLKGNKPFYARVLYKDATGNFLQLLPNPFRQDNYFNGGVVYDIPSGKDRFDLEVTPPFGQEDIVLYAGTSPLGDINLQTEGEVYQVVSKPAELPLLSRGVKIQKKDGEKQTGPSEFSEEKLSIRTGK